MRKSAGLVIAVVAAWCGATGTAGAVTPLPATTLPSSFSWGVAGSAYQAEGGFTNSNWDVYNANPVNRQDPYGTSVDFRHRYRSDIQLARAMGVTQFRFGINWARVEPEEGVFDKTELAYYDDLVKAIVDAGMVPQPTLDHWVYPKWVYDQDAWNNAKTVDDFVTYTTVVAEHFKGLGARWLTFNEAFFYIISETARRPQTVQALMSRNLIAAHRAAYDVIHRIDPGSQVSSNIVWLADDNAAGAVSDSLFLNGTQDKMDFIGFDYYYESVGDSGLPNILLGRPWETPQYPQGIYVALHQLAARFPSKPIYVSESGMPTRNGMPRADGWTRSQALQDTVYWVQRAWAEGIDVRGFQYWSLTDNFEFGDYAPRFGLYTVDVLTDKTLTRKPTDAVPTYKAIIGGRGVPASFRPKQLKCSLSGMDLTCPDAADPRVVRQGEPGAVARAATALTRLGLRAKRVGRTVRLIASLRGASGARVRLTLTRDGRTALQRTVTLRGGKASAAFLVRRGGRFRVRATSGGTTLRSRTTAVMR